MGRNAAWAVIITFGMLAAGACSTSQVVPLPELPEPPAYTRVPHPDSPDLGDIQAVLAGKDAPSPENLKDCDKDFQKLRGLVQSGDELKQAARELVGMFPEEYHWCFYWQFVRLESKLKELTYHDERQAEVIRTYAFLGPVAQAFREQYKDSRYLRSAAYQYKSVSQRVFLRKLTLTPEGAQNLFVGASTEPNALWQSFKPGETPVLEKYGFAPPSAQAFVTPPATQPFQPLEPAAATQSAAPAQDAGVWASSAEAPPTAASEAPMAPPATSPEEVVGREPADAQDWQSEFQSLDSEMETVTTDGSAGPAPASVEPAPPIESAPAVEAPPAETVAEPSGEAGAGAESELNIDFEAGQDFPELDSE